MQHPRRMTLFPLQAVQSGQFYLDVAIRNALKEAGKVRENTKIKDRRNIDKSRTVERKKIIGIANNLKGQLDAVVKGFPTLSRLSPFYQELFDLTFKTVELKKRLATITWIVDKVEWLKTLYLTELKRCDDIQRINKIRNQFLARVGSLVQKKNSTFTYLEDARKKIRGFPTFKEMYTACICGFPNVGKSTLLGALTSAHPEIKPYAFTTKSILLGYIDKKVQVIDSPGAFRTSLYKANAIEKQAFLALKYLAEGIVYVFDISESCGYSIEDQWELFEFVKKEFPKPMVIYLSKQDLIPIGELEEFKRKLVDFEVFWDSSILRKRLLTMVITPTP